jgi:hypothetical protein
MKEEHCFVATPNFEACSQLRHTMADLSVQASYGAYGQQVQLEYERYTAPELLFKPHMIGRDFGGSMLHFHI